MVAEIRFGIESIDHIAIPVRDLAINQAFYVDVLGLQFKTTRRNPDGTPRQTYVLAGKNIIGLHLPGVLAELLPAPLRASGSASRANDSSKPRKISKRPIIRFVAP